MGIRRVYADSEFCSVPTIQVLEDLGKEYLIKKPRRCREQKFIERMCGDTRVKRDHGMYSQDFGWGFTTLVAVPRNRRSHPKEKDDGGKVVFITNIEFDDGAVEDVVSRYRHRWVIENSYKTVKDFLGRTTSKEYVVRLFYFVFAVLLYNLWLLVDIVVRDLDRLEVLNHSPELRAKRVLSVVVSYFEVFT